MMYQPPLYLPSLEQPPHGAPAKVVALRGIPGSGKSTLAKKAFLRATPGTAIYINNDDLAATLFQKFRSPHTAEILAAVRLTAIQTALKTPEVRLVIVDNTNLSVRTLLDLETLTLKLGANFIVDDTLLSTPVEICLERDKTRENPVGEEVIKRMAEHAATLTPWRTSKLGS